MKMVLNIAEIVSITINYEVIYVIKTVMKYHLKKIDTSFHQPLPNMVQRLFADVINDGCHLLLDVRIIYFISCDCIMNSSLSYRIY
jgi:hypothetical protein